MVFIEDYDINVCRHLIQGVDVWLNNPRRPLEASGTSGQKAVLNGGLNLSVLDGWWAEAYDGAERLRHRRRHGPRLRRDHRPPRRRSIVPRARSSKSSRCIYDRDVDGLPRRLDPADDELDQLAGLAFSAHRMVMDYVQRPTCRPPAD